MDLTFGPKSPNRVVRIRFQNKILRIESSSIDKATWERTEDGDVSSFSIFNLKCIAYFDTDHTFLSDYTFYALAKLPNQCKYLVLCENSLDFGAFVLQGGSNTSLKFSSGLVACLAKACYILFKRNQRDDLLCDDGACYIKPVSIGQKQHTVSDEKTLHDVLSMNGYNSGPALNRVCMVALEGLGIIDEGYPSLEEFAGPMTGDFATGITRKTFNSAILGGDKDIACKPSQVSLSQAIRVLKWQEDRKWKLLSDAAIPAADIQLESLHLDVDSGIFHLSAIAMAPGGIPMDTRGIVEGIKTALPIEMTEKCMTAYVSRGKQWRFCQSSESKPTIFQKGIYVRLPQPDHTNDSIKIWIHLPESMLLKLPDKFLDTIKVIFDRVALSIVGSESPGSQKEILLNILRSRSSSQIARIPGGITLAVASFVEISRIHPQVELVFETYNGKLKGLSTAVNVCDGVPALHEASAKLVESCIRTDSLFSIVSKLILNKIVSLVVGASSFGFGFRANYRGKNAPKSLVLASLNLGLSENSKVQLFPLAYLDKDICPNVSSPSTVSTTHSNGVRRSQFYLECWSMHKASNVSCLWSYSRTGQNLKAATTKSNHCSACQNDTCATLNTSVLRNGMLDTCHKFDQSFELSSKIGGSRFEIAIQPTLVSGNDHFAFDFRKSIESCWEHIQSNVRFDDNRSIVKFGVLNTAACFVAYRAALDELSLSTPGSDSQQQLFCFVRYMNAILHSLCNGLYADGQNPKLFLSKWGLAAGRPLAMIPTMPLLVWERIRLWDMACPPPTVEAPFPDSVPTEQPNRINMRIAENTDLNEIEDCMICWSCNELFFGGFDTRLRLLKDHLKQYNHWVDSAKAVKTISGKMWRIDFENKRKSFETKLHSVEGNDDQQWAYKLAMSWTNLCLVGVPGSGKTWVLKNIGVLLESIFFKPGEVFFCSPLGRVAMNLHPDARTLHRIMNIKPTQDRYFPESLEELAKHLDKIKPRPFTNLKLIVGTEMFMCTTPHLQSLLQFVKTSLQNLNIKVLFDGDPIQLSMSCKSSTGSRTSGIPFLITPELKTACPGIRHVVFEDTMHFRIQNQDKLRHLKLMRSHQADDSTLKFFKDTRIDQSRPFLTLFVTLAAASNFNDNKFAEHFRSQTQTFKAAPPPIVYLISEDTHVLSQQRVRLDVSDVRDLPVETVIKVASDVPIIVVQNCWGIPCGSDDRKCTQVFVGNGAAGTFVKFEDDTIVVMLTIAGKQGLFRLKRVEFPVETQSGSICVRRQFPIMLAWATNIHKVQGMQFDQLQVDFELGKNDGGKEFYEGMAYMALSRANAVEILGGIHLKLLNNVNIRSLQWWDKELADWKAFKSGNVTKFVFRNTIHEANHRLASLHRRYSIVARASAPSEDDCVDIDIDDADDQSFVTALTPMSAPAPVASAKDKVEAGAKAKAAIASTGTPAPKPFYAPAPPKKRQADLSPTSASASASARPPVPKQSCATDQNTAPLAAAKRLTPAPSPAPAPDPARVGCPPALAHAQAPSASRSNINSDDENEMELVVLPAVLPAETDSATSASAPDYEQRIACPQSKPPAAKKQKQNPKIQTLVKNFSRNSFDPMTIRGHASTATLQKMAAMLSDSIEELQMPNFLCSHHSHPDTYGEVAPALVKHMMKKYSNETSVDCEEQTTFIDLGSGHGGLVCLIATLRKFQKCFGVELEPLRASFAYPLADSFLKEVQRRNIRHSNVEIIAGDFFKCEITKRNLQSASLIWVNNVKFESFNYSLLKMLDEFVPFGCIVVSFVSFITRQNDTRFRQISDESVANATYWSTKPQNVYVMQKQQQ